MAKQINLMVKITAKPEHCHTLEEILIGFPGLARSEKGCLRYELFQSEEDKCVFFIVERWASESDLQKHLQQGYLERFHERSETFLALPVEKITLKQLL